MRTELSIIIPTIDRSRKLCTLMSGIAASLCDQDAIEVVLVVDGLDERPLEVRGLLPTTIRFRGLTKEHAGPAAARNHAIEHARGEWVLFFDDDARVDEATIAGHLELIRRDPDAPTAFLGRVDWPEELIDSPWRRLLEQSSMLFFWHRMESGRSYNYRHFWTSNLSVRRENVLAVGGFHEGFPSAMHEDIELGWRLERSVGMQVRVDKSIHSLHDHALDPIDYLRREHKSGASAAAARTINRAFHDEIWSWVDPADAALEMLETLFLSPARSTLSLLHEWAHPSERRPSDDELQAVYLAHLPLKRIAFLHGYLGKPFEALWQLLTAGAAADRSSAHDDASADPERATVRATPG